MSGACMAVIHPYPSYLKRNQGRMPTSSLHKWPTPTLISEPEATSACLSRHPFDGHLALLYVALLACSLPRKGMMQMAVPMPWSKSQSASAFEQAPCMHGYHPIVGLASPIFPSARYYPSTTLHTGTQSTAHQLAKKLAQARQRGWKGPDRSACFLPFLFPALPQPPLAPAYALPPPPSQSLPFINQMKSRLQKYYK